MRDYLRSERDAEFAKRFVQQIIAHCKTFRTIPHRGTRHDEIRAGLRVVSWKRTVTIAFCVSDQHRLVVIVGVFYRGRDVPSALRKRMGD